MVGLTVAITAGVMTWEQDGSFNEKGERVLDKHRKTIHLDASTTPMIFDLEQGPEAKGWSRVGIVRIDGDMMTICVDFPQYPRPTSFEGQGSQEVVTLRRAR